VLRACVFVVALPYGWRVYAVSGAVARVESTGLVVVAVPKVRDTFPRLAEAGTGQTARVRVLALAGLRRMNAPYLDVAIVHRALVHVVAAPDAAGTGRRKALTGRAILVNRACVVVVADAAGWHMLASGILAAVEGAQVSVLAVTCLSHADPVRTHAVDLASRERFACGRVWCVHTPDGLVAVVVGTWIEVVTGSLGCAGTNVRRVAEVVVRTGIAVIATVIMEVIQTHAVGTGIIGALPSVVAVLGLSDAIALEIAVVVDGTTLEIVARDVLRLINAPFVLVTVVARARVAVVTLARGARADSCLNIALVLIRAFVAVVADRRAWRVHTPKPGIAGIDGADVVVVTTETGSSRALTEIIA